MAEINAKDLTAKTSPASTDSMLLFGTTSNEGAKITVDNLADNILSRIATKTFPNKVGGSSAATILAQLATLNSNTNPSFGNVAFSPSFGNTSLINSAESLVAVLADMPLNKPFVLSLGGNLCGSLTGVTSNSFMFAKKTSANYSLSIIVTDGQFFTVKVSNADGTSAGTKKATMTSVILS